jgi:hypothetical protein
MQPPGASACIFTINSPIPFAFNRKVETFVQTEPVLTKLFNSYPFAVVGEINLNFVVPAACLFAGQVCFSYILSR